MVVLLDSVPYGDMPATRTLQEVERFGLGDTMMQNGKVIRTRPSFGVLIVLPLLLSLVAPIANAGAAQEQATGYAPEDIWSDDYNNMIFPWASANDRVLQFKEYHSYETMKNRMLRLAEENPDIFEFHEGMNGGTNARGEEVTANAYEGWYYGHASPWMKITADVQDGDYNPFVGDNGNYADRHDVMIVGNHHAREWMSYTVAIMQLEVIAFSYGNIAYDNDGDGLVDEDPWGDANGDGILDDDGDCLGLDASFQDSNGDGTACGPGDLGVDEDYSEQFITDLVDSREIYLIPMLNVDGNIYDREVFCPAPAWESCPSGGWRKNLRDNTATGVTPIPDLQEEVDEDCDGVDLNRNYQFEWGAPLGATGPLIPGTCTPAEGELDGSNNDVYNGPVDDRDNDGDGQINEDHVDGKDDDADGVTDEDWWGGNSEPETKFIQDLTEMNDDTGDGSSEFKATLTHHSYSELILYPWGHCTDCQSPDHEQLKYHGQQMADMTQYANLQSSDLYPTSGDFCDWHYGVHGSYCYTSEIGTAFHQHEDDIDHIAVRNLGTGFYIAEIADSPRERADLEIANISQQNYLAAGDKVEVPAEGDIPVDLCVANDFPYSESNSMIEWRTVKPSRLQSDYGPREWATTAWESVPVMAVMDETCSVPSGNGTILRGMVPISETATGKLHYKATVSTLAGSDLFQYPSDGAYYELDLSYRAAYGSVIGSFLMFGITASFVWGGLAVCLRMMLSDDEEAIDLTDALLEEEKK